jgi:hypothetical protein
MPPKFVVFGHSSNIKQKGATVQLPPQRILRCCCQFFAAFYRMVEE